MSLKGHNRREMKRRLKAQRAAMGARLAQQRAELRRKTQPLRKRRRRRWRFLLLALLLLLYMLLRGCDCQCDCGPGAPATPEPDLGLDAAPPRPDAAPPTVAPKKKAKKPRRKLPRFKGKLKTKHRPGYNTGTPGPQPWLPAFRLQVAARAPRLARCFEGSERPGALKWTTTLDPKTGLVADHYFAGTLAGAALSEERRQCLVSALSGPKYTLPLSGSDPNPTRVSMVIEF